MTPGFQPKGGVQIELNLAKAKKLQGLSDGLRRSYLTCGIHEDAGTYEDEEGEGAVSVAKVGFWQEYGTRKMPARPWFYPTLKAKTPELRRMYNFGLSMVVAGKWTMEHALSRVGFALQIWLQNAIKSNTPPALSPAYAEERRKRFPVSGSRTLIRSGLLLRSIRYAVSVAGGTPKKGQESGPPANRPLKASDLRSRKAVDSAAYLRNLKSKQAQQRAAAQADPQGHQAAFDAQRRVRPAKIPGGES